MIYKCDCGSEIYSPGNNSSVFRSRLINHLSSKTHLIFTCLEGLGTNYIKRDFQRFNLNEMKLQAIIDDYIYIRDVVKPTSYSNKPTPKNKKVKTKSQINNNRIQNSQNTQNTQNIEEDDLQDD